jgi:hypothetical protein
LGLEAERSRLMRGGEFAAHPAPRAVVDVVAEQLATTSVGAAPLRSDVREKRGLAVFEADREDHVGRLDGLDPRLRPAGELFLGQIEQAAAAVPVARHHHQRLCPDQLALEGE